MGPQPHEVAGPVHWFDPIEAAFLLRRRFVTAAAPRGNGPHLLRSQASGCAAGATGVPLSCCGRESFSRTRQLQDKQSNSQLLGSRMR